MVLVMHFRWKYSTQNGPSCDRYCNNFESFVIIRESVDSLCRDGTDTPYTQYEIKHSKSLQKNNIKLL